MPVPAVNREILPPMDIRSMLVVPIRLSGRVLGMALNYTLGEKYAITQEEVELASGVANSVALAVENARLYGETRQRLAESQGVQRVTTSLLRKNSLKEVLEIICNEALNLTDATGSAVLLLEENGSLQGHQRGRRKIIRAWTGCRLRDRWPDRQPVGGTSDLQRRGEHEPGLPPRPGHQRLCWQLH